MNSRFLKILVLASVTVLPALTNPLQPRAGAEEKAPPATATATATATDRKAADDKNFKISQLVYQPTSNPLNYLVTTYSRTTDSISISHESGQPEDMQKKSFDYVETQKEVTRKPQGQNTESSATQTDLPLIEADNLNETVKTLFLKKITSENDKKPLRPATGIRQLTASGRLAQPFNMADLLHFGSPLFFTHEKLNPVSTWGKEVDFKDFELPVLSFRQVYKVKDFGELNRHKIIHFEYTMYAGLESTKITTDPKLLAAIAELKQANIEKVGYEGVGEVYFDYERGTVITQTLTLTRRLQKSFVLKRSKTVQDINTTLEFAEALIN